ncbi:MAG: coproporphyrinogen III oxidase [Litoreibacter sp.]|nr:coproporphyrinogen III oxidase [Litoreibacter sp.]
MTKRSARWIDGKRTGSATALTRLPNWSSSLTSDRLRSGGFGLYIHWPFCQAKCPYCDFNSHVWQHIDQSRWTKAYLSELDRVAAETPDRVLNSVFFGGGTPSLMEPETVDQILSRIRANWPIANDFEVTLEANPTSVEAQRFAGYRQAGVNRVSMGFQALNDNDLKALGRLHNVSDALKAYEIAQEVFDRFSFDLIYARQNQTVTDWEKELRQALAMGPTHLSLYQLTIEEGTAFGDRFARGLLRGLPDEEVAAKMYEITQALTVEAGLPAYEISNHARANDVSLHNLIYWRGGDYLGIGPGAHGRVSIGKDRFATDTELAPQVWLQQVETLGSGEKSRDVITKYDQGLEYVMMSLRLAEGCDLDRLAEISSNQVKLNNINKLESLSLISRENSTLRVPTDKRILLNSILAELVA